MKADAPVLDGDNTSWDGDGGWLWPDDAKLNADGWTLEHGAAWLEWHDDTLERAGAKLKPRAGTWKTGVRPFETPEYLLETCVHPLKA